MKAANKKNKLIGILGALSLFLLILIPPQVVAAAALELRVGNMVFSKEVKSMKDLRFEKMVRQTTDYSCGAASLATILTYYFGSETSEKVVLDAILSATDQETLERVKNEGVSLLDLKNYADSLGYEGRGFQLEAEELSKLDRPSIVLINFKGYNHFVVLKEVVDDKVYLADPARGNTTTDLSEFMTMWNGILLAFQNPTGERIITHALSVKPGLPIDKLALVRRFQDVSFAVSPSEF